MKICTKGIWNDTVPGITYDNQGISNYYHLQKALENNFPRGEKGQKIWSEFVSEMKEAGKNNRYDCIIGVSGGVDSSYLMHLMKKKYGLRPLAVNLDNGWSSDIAVQNIRKITQQLDIDLETYVINYEEIKDLLKSYVRASIAWIDIPTDRAIKGALYKVASRENIKFIIRGNDFRSEGKQPREWTTSDHKQLTYIHKKFGNGVKLKTYPPLRNFDLFKYGYVKKIKEIRPFYFLDYKKQEAKSMLIEKYDWQDYGGHHHENIFTKFAMSYWLPKKFGIDKRIINLSAQVVSGAISRDEALNQIKQPFDTDERLEEMKTYVLKKLDITIQEFEEIWKKPNNYYYDFPNNFSFREKIMKYGNPIIKKIYKLRPMSFFEMEMRQKNNKK